MRLAGITLLLGLALAAPAAAAPSLVPLGTFSQPVWAGSPPGDRARVFVAERTGRIRVVEDGETSTFMDISASVQSTPGNERGLLSLAFPADYASTGKFYAYVTAAAAGDIEIREYTGTSPTPTRVLVTIPHPRDNHNGGQLQFGPDGLLYAGTGDGGGGNDPDRQAQDPASDLGKLLRIDTVTGTVTRASMGLRNPWRFSFAPDGRIVIADVGQGAVEEINVGLAANYGWPCKEGTRDGGAPDPRCAGVASAAPVLEKTHGAPDNFCSITGGYVVRDPGLPTLHGRYVYGDFCNAALRSLDLDAPATDAPAGITVPSLSSFGEDACGRLLVVSLSGPVSRVTDGPSTPCEPVDPTPTPTPTATPTPTPTADPTPSATPTATLTPQAQPAVTPTPPAVRDAAAPCRVSMRVTGQYSLAKRRFLSVALRTDKACRVTVSAPRFTRTTVRLSPGERRVVRIRRARGNAQRITVTVRTPAGTIRKTVRAR